MKFFMWLISAVCYVIGYLAYCVDKVDVGIYSMMLGIILLVNYIYWNTDDK